MKVSILLFLSMFSLAGAFAPRHFLSRPTLLHGADGAPEYEKRNVVLLQPESVGDGSAVLLHIDRIVDDEEPFDYQPGHVLALEIQYNATRDTTVDNKTMVDAKRNDGWMRAPYTVSGATFNTINILLKVVGAKSKAFATASPNTPLRLGGKFKVPIVQGISENTKRLVMISTGVGIGPCVGALEELLSGNCPFVIDLISSFRFPNEVLYGNYLGFWVEAYENKFHFQPLVTNDVGRLSSLDENMKLVTHDDICSVTETHYHLIGNGEMVNEFKAGLLQAGVPEEKITFEIYFNHKAEPSKEAVERIENVIRAAALDPAK